MLFAKDSVLVVEPKEVKIKLEEWRVAFEEKLRISHTKIDT